MEYVFVYINSGKGKYSGISLVVNKVNNKFVDAGFEKTKLLERVAEKPGINSSKRAKKWKEVLGNFEPKNFHSYLGKPFLFKKSDLVLLNFSERQINYRYFWKDNILKSYTSN